MPLPTRRRSPLARIAAGLAVLLAAGALAAGSTTAPAYADANPVTPGNFTGYGFDQCDAPSQSAMTTWLRHSPFLAAGIYISGDSRACRVQSNLTPRWVRKQLRTGWRLLPITLGPQASCQPRFPRYGNDETISPRRGKSGKYPKARRQARAEAVTTVEAATRLGIVPGSTLWYDLEGFDLGNRDCRESALAFLSAYTNKIHALDYVSGVYSSAGSGIKMLDDARVDRPGSVTLPDAIWIARWDNVADTSTSYIRPDGWLPGGRMKQYQGGHDETWGGTRINIDRDWLDLGLGSVAPEVEHCGGVTVDATDYPALVAGVKGDPMVRTLKCLLKEQGVYTGRLNRSYNTRLLTATQAWQSGHGFAVTQDWRRQEWVSLLAAGRRPVLKFGSASEDVRRLQRALDAGRRRTTLPITGSFDRATQSAVTAWQKRHDRPQSGIVLAADWKALQAGAR